MSDHDAIREHMAALGSPVFHLTDEEMEEGVQRVAEMMAATGISGSEVVFKVPHRSGHAEWQTLQILDPQEGQ